MPRWIYLSPISLFTPAFLAMAIGGGWAWFLPIFTFVLVPIADQLLPGTTRNATETEEQARKGDLLLDLVIYAIVPAQWALLGAYLWRITEGGFAPWELVGITGTMAIACGVFGINVGHELGHRRKRHEQWLAKAALTTTLYGHFFIEHNRGHHRRVATPNDPASAHRGQSVYGFWLRSVSGGMASAWELEASRLKRQDKSPWSWENETLRAWSIQAVLMIALIAVAGPLTGLAWLIVATGGFLLLETVNYLEHYGLSRARTERGTYERVRPHHSWNSEHWVGRILLFDVTRHSDHHANATRPYHILRHMETGPELPAGYPALIMASLVPPLFDRLMDAPLAEWHAVYDLPEQAVAK